MQMIGIRGGGPVSDWWLQQSPINYSAPWQRASQRTVVLLFGLQCCYHPPRVSASCSKICNTGLEVDWRINIGNTWTDLIEPGNVQTDKNIEYLKVIKVEKWCSRVLVFQNFELESWSVEAVHKGRHSRATVLGTQRVYLSQWVESAPFAGATKRPKSEKEMQPFWNRYRTDKKKYDEKYWVWIQCVSAVVQAKGTHTPHLYLTEYWEDNLGKAKKGKSSRSPMKLLSLPITVVTMGNKTTCLRYSPDVVFFASVWKPTFFTIMLTQWSVAP